MNNEHTDKKYEEELKKLREEILYMGGLVEDQIQKAVKSLVDRDSALAEIIIERDHEVNRLDVDIDDLCIRLLALHQPAGRDLRFITTGLKITTDLERIGDMAVNFCERTLELNQEPQLKPYIDIPRMATISQRMIRESLDAFVREDTDLALKVCKDDQEVDDLNSQIFRETISFMIGDPLTINRAMKISSVSKYLERIADHATNIAEMVIFMVKGKSIRHMKELPSSVKNSMAPAQKILVVEDEPDIRKLVQYNLAQERFSVLEAEDGEEALKLLQHEKPSLVILDLMLPGLSGMELCKLLRQRSDTAKLPILMLTAKAGEADRIVGLEMGADDYLAKPFSPREMVARVRAILRRSEAKPETEAASSYEKGPLKIDFSTYEIFVRSRAVKLTLKEFELLRFLVQNPNRVLNRDQLLDRVWGGDTFVTPRTVDVHIRRLRKAVEKDDRKPKWILTVRGVGYKFDEKAVE